MSNPNDSLEVKKEMRRIRILFVAHDSHFQGAQLTLLNILRDLDQDKFAPLVVAAQTGPFTEEIERMGIPFQKRPVMRWVYRRTHLQPREVITKPWKLIRTPAIIALYICGLPIRVARLMSLIKRNKIDLVHTNTVTVVEGAIAAKLVKVPHIWHLHENISANQEVLKILPTKKIATYLVPKLSTYIAVVSNTLGMQLFGNHFSLSQIKVIYNGVDTNRFSPNESTNFLHRELGIPDGISLVGICGAVQKSKGLETFIKAAASKSIANTHFLIIGDGPETQIQYFVDIVAKNGLSERIHFTGWRNDVPKILCELKVVVIASAFESFGLNAIEGMAAGIPVVATRCGGPEEIIEHGVTGYLVEANSETELAFRLQQVLSDPLMAEKMGNLGRMRVLQKFSSHSFKEKIERLLLDAVNKR